jgi:hypothetical protein
MLEPHLFGPWSTSVVEKVGVALTDVKERKGNIGAILGGHGDLEVEAQCGFDGVISLTGLAISGFRMVRVPRVWDDPVRREAERDAAYELTRLARTFKATLDEWTKSVSQLATWIRYAPPPPNAKPIEPWFDDQSEDDDGGRRRYTDKTHSNHHSFLWSLLGRRRMLGTLRSVSVNLPMFFRGLANCSTQLRLQTYV